MQSGAFSEIGALLRAGGDNSWMAGVSSQSICSSPRTRR